MLVLIVLLSCLVSILVITLLNIVDVNMQLIVFLSILVGLMLFKIVFDKLVKRNKTNPISKNLISNVNLNNQSTVNNQVRPSNFNQELNSNNANSHAFVNVDVNGNNKNANTNVNNRNNGK